MSVYKFMAGIVVETEDEHERDFDPHHHRKIRKPTSYLDTMTHMLKGSLGAGILAMPYATARLGVIWSTVTLTIIAVFAAYCIQLLISNQYKLCKRWRRGYMGYSKSMRFAVKDGPPCLRWAAPCLYWFVEEMLIIWQLGICTIYFVFVAENLKQILDFYGIVMSLRLILLCLLPPSVLLNLIRDLKMLSPLSSLSNLVTFFGLMLVFFYLIEDDLVLSPDKLQLRHWTELPSFIGTALFALEAVGVILALEYNMEHPKQFVGFTGLFNIGMVIITGLYLCVGTFGYLKYGKDVKASITLNLPQEQKKAQASKILFAIAIFLTFPLQNFVAYNMLLRRLQKLCPSAKCPADYALRVALVLLPWLLAVAVPRLGPFISLFGALCLSLLAFVFPSFMSICICYGEPTGYGPAKYKLFKDIFFITLGTIMLFSGVFASIEEILEEILPF